MEIIMYTFESRVRYSETGEDGRLTLNSIINYFQDCTNFHSEDLGVGVSYLEEKQIMWVLMAWQIVVTEYPKFGEHLTIGTQSIGCEKMYGYRNFLITKQDGSQVAIAHSTWVLMDMKENKPKIVTPDVGDVYGRHEPLPMDYAPRKIKMPRDGEEQEGFVVKEYHLDTNHHVNNGQYVRMAMQAAGLGKIKELRVEYKTQAMLGDTIIPVVSREENQVYVALKNEEGKTYANVQVFV